MMLKKEVIIPYCPPQEVLENPAKRQKLEELSHFSADFQSKDHSGDKRSYDVPQFHNLPQNSLPILQQPYELGHFFTDYDADQLKRYSGTIDGITKLFPPPLPPATPPSERRAVEKIHIPFIYPPPPVIKPDPYIDDNEYFIKKWDQEAKNEESEEKETETPEEQEQASKEGEEQPDPVLLAPLPFPPPSFMPYPLNANKASMIPHDLFTDFLDASAFLPRIDMVTASAAGSLTDLRPQANIEGFSIQQYEEDKLFANSDEDDDRETTSKNNQAYYDNIITKNEFDRRYKGIFDPFASESSQTEPQVTVKGNLSDVKNFHPQQEYSHEINYLERINEKLPKLKELFRRNGDAHYTPNYTQEKKRDSLLTTITGVEKFEQSKKTEILEQRKNAIIHKIKQLSESRILLTDEEGSLLKDANLSDYKTNRAIDRDLELLMLKFQTTFDSLRQLTTFYESSNKVYKKYNVTISNKLLKLRNFFQFQKAYFEGIISNEKTLNELVDLNNKESTRLYFELAGRNYGSELRSLLKAMTKETEDLDPEKKAKFQEIVESLKVNLFTANLDKLNDVNDFMPLVSTNEFNMITSNRKNKADVKLNLNNHPVFRNALYESGSDSNFSSYSSSTPEVPKRGRRLQLEVEEDKLSSETYLLAEITKHFVGPLSVNNDQCNEDFEKMGIKSQIK